MRRALAASLVALGAFGPAKLWAEGAERDYVVLLLPDRATPTARRLQAEISKLDLAIKVTQTAEPVDPDEPHMAELAQLFGGEALVLLSADGRVATIWFSDGQQGDRLKRVVQADSGSADLRSESVIVGTMELLRVRLLTKREPPPPATAPRAPAPPDPAPPQPPVDPGYRPLTLGALVGLDKPSSALSFSSSYQLNLDLVLTDTLSLRASARLPAAKSRVQQARATAEVSSVITGAGLAAGLNPLPSLRLDLFGGAGAAHVVADGFSEIAAKTRSQSAWVFVSLGALRASLRLTPALSLTLQGGLAVAAVPVEVWLNDTRASVWGRPSFFSGIGLEFSPNFR